MLLTSYERMRRYLPGKGDNTKTDEYRNERDILIWLNSVSRKIENYLNREVYIQSRTEYFDLGYNSVQFWVEAPPITTITSVKLDSTGLYDGSESTLDDSEYHLSSNSNSVILENPQNYTGHRIVQIVYTGGLALHAVQSIFAITVIAGTWTVGNFCRGGSSGAVGIITAASVSALTIEILYGVFEVGETLTEFTNENATGSDATATLNSKTQTALCESDYSGIVEGCENEIRYMIRHKDDFENTGSQRDGTTVRRDGTRQRRYGLEPETIDMLDLTNAQRVAL